MLKTTLTAAALCAGVLLPAASASAWQASSQGGSVSFTAGAGEQNLLQVSEAAGEKLRFRDSGGGASAAGACTTSNGNVDCAADSLVIALTIDLGDQHDVGLLPNGLPSNTYATVKGGSGNDKLSNADLTGRVEGGPGTDILRPGRHDDQVDGGSGLDAVDYSERTNAVKVTLGDGNVAGENGETDVLTGIEAVFGGAGADILTGQSGDEQFVPGPGKDLVNTGAGKDVLDLRDGFRDTVNCGPDFDTVLADQLDAVAECESVAVKHTLASGGGLNTVPPSPEDLPSASGELTPDAGSPGYVDGGTAAAGVLAPAAGSASDRVAPVLRRLRLSRPAIRRGGPRALRATMLRFVLSERAAVVVTVERCAGRRCRTGRRVATVRRTGLSGAATLRLTAKVGRRTLRPGLYRLKVVATDAAGNRSTAATKRLTVRR